jgi:hypothetical protein
VISVSSSSSSSNQDTTFRVAVILRWRENSKPGIWSERNIGLRCETVRYGRRAWRRIYPKDTATWEAVATIISKKAETCEDRAYGPVQSWPEGMSRACLPKKEQSEIPRMDMHVLLTPTRLPYLY